MTTRTRIQSTSSAIAYTKRHARKLIPAALGNNSGTVEVTAGLTEWVWVRLRSDPNQVVRALMATAVQPTADIMVEVEWVDAVGYVIRGIATTPVYGTNPWVGSVPAHAAQHERYDLGVGGFDPIDVTARMILPMRARAQATPDWTVHVEICDYVDYLGAPIHYTGGNSGAFSPPSGILSRRCDLLYFDTNHTLQILQGTVTTDGSVPTRPTQLDQTVAIAFVYLDGNMTAITEDYIFEARQFWRALSNAGAFRIGGAIQPPQITANQNDYAPTGMSGAATLEVYSDASRDITGVDIAAATGGEGRLIVIQNVGTTNNIVLRDEDTNSLAANRFDLGGSDLTLTPGVAVILQYNNYGGMTAIGIISARWMCLGLTPSASGGTVDVNAIHTNAAGEINGLTAKATPADNDAFVLEDSAAGYVKKETLWSAIKATFKTYFDTLYSVLGHSHTAVLTVKEQDGAPSVANVTEIKVSNGTLTDNTGGSVSIDIVGAPHDIFSATHSDTTGAASPVDGDIIIGNVTPKWSKLAISVPAANVRNVLGVDNAETRPSWKTALDATSPADIAGTASAGTSLVFSHRDHVHRGVVSVNKSGGATLYGAVTLSEGANITLTQAGQDIAIASAAGGSLTVKEEDGAPSVANVTEIKVPNGSLTDNTGGSVSIAFSGGSVSVDNNGTLVGTRPTINFIPGANVSYVISDNAGSNRVDITIAAAGGPSGLVDPTAAIMNILGWG